MTQLKLKLVSVLLLITYFFSFSIAPVFAAVSYTYDPNGNMTSDSEFCYTYNQANQLSTVKKCSTNRTVAEYVYDYNGQRLIKKEYENGSLTRTIYSPDKSYETKKEASNSATTNTTYYYANDQLVAKKNPDNTKTYYHNDHLGSTSTQTDESGNLAEETTYYPFGEVRAGGTKSKYQYTGQEKDNETGLNYYNARYYSSHIGRFTQPDTMLPDPYDPQQLNRYSYVRNNPLKYTDPSGGWAVIVALIASVTLDYGWSAHDYAEQQQIITDPNSTQEEREAAVLEQQNIVGTEITAYQATLGLDAALPLDDLLRKGTKYLNQRGAINAMKRVGGTGYRNFNALKSAIGACNKPDACHHLVGQHPSNLFRFGSEQIHNTKNILILPDGAGDIHRQITGFYNTSAKKVFPNASDGRRPKVFRGTRG